MEATIFQWFINAVIPSSAGAKKENSPELILGNRNYRIQQKSEGGKNDEWPGFVSWIASFFCCCGESSKDDQPVRQPDPLPRHRDSGIRKTIIESTKPSTLTNDGPVAFPDDESTSSLSEEEINAPACVSIIEAFLKKIDRNLKANNATIYKLNYISKQIDSSIFPEGEEKIDPKVLVSYWHQAQEIMQAEREKRAMD